jgi:CHAT domain-containing protein
MSAIVPKRTKPHVAFIAVNTGQAFFYAGTRAVLVTNWSVHSASARVLMSDLFRRQAADPALSRAYWG